MNDVVLMTGASGFLGRRLLRAWLRGTSAHLVACVRPRNGRSPAERLALSANGHDAALQEAYQERVFVLAADLAAPELGLDAALQEELAESVTHIVHCGGLVRFDLPLDVARRTNTEGTATMLALARRCTGLRRFDHISTAFVAGRRRGPVFEHELDCGQEHHNAYERSKFEGERLVREAAAELPIAVHRPSIITCDRRSGDLSPHGAVGRLLAAYAAGALTRLPGRADAPLDLVPADFVAEAVFALAGREETLCGCFHLAAGRERSTTLGEIRDLAAAGFGRAPLTFSGDDRADDARADEGGDNGDAMRGEIALYAPYLDGEPSFDLTEASRALAGSGIAAPGLSEYFRDLVQGVERMARSGRRSSEQRGN